jgi:hypothetical protein
MALSISRLIRLAALQQTDDVRSMELSVCRLTIHRFTAADGRLHCRAAVAAFVAAAVAVANSPQPISVPCGVVGTPSRCIIWLIVNGLQQLQRQRDEDQDASRVSPAAA